MFTDTDTTAELLGLDTTGAPEPHVLTEWEGNFPCENFDPHEPTEVWLGLSLDPSVRAAQMRWVDLSLGDMRAMAR